MDQIDLGRRADEEAERRRQTDRDRLRHAAEQLLTPEGWIRWVLTRARISAYSTANCMLLAQQCHELGIEPTRIHGESAWRKLGRRVRDGETPLRVAAPVRLKPHAKDGSTAAVRLLFRTAFVYELSQTEPVPGSRRKDLADHHEPLSGDTHSHLLEPLCLLARTLGYSVSFEPVAGTAQGWCDQARRQIAVERRAPANAQVRALIHECAHALGADYESYGRERAEVIAEVVTYVVASGAGLRLDGESAPYVASWGVDGAIEAVTEFAQTIDKLARVLEGALRVAAASS